MREGWDEDGGEWDNDAVHYTGYGLSDQLDD
jgi:hypothetical protein